MKRARNQSWKLLWSCFVLAFALMGCRFSAHQLPSDLQRFQYVYPPPAPTQVFVTHAESGYDPNATIQSGLARELERLQGSDIYFLQKNASETEVPVPPRAHAVSSQYGEHTIAVLPDHVVLMGGGFAACLQYTLWDVVRNHTNGRTLHVYYPMDAAYVLMESNLQVRWEEDRIRKIDFWDDVIFLLDRFNEYWARPISDTASPESSHQYSHRPHALTFVLTRDGIPQAAFKPGRGRVELDSLSEDGSEWVVVHFVSSK